MTLHIIFIEVESSAECLVEFKSVEWFFWSCRIGMVILNQKIVFFFKLFLLYVYFYFVFVFTLYLCLHEFFQTFQTYYDLLKFE